jgi:hypothetical protein
MARVTARPAGRCGCLARPSSMMTEADHFPMLSAPQQFERFLRETLDSVSH